jgi:L-methionine (R)-S-oxide reductase
MSEKILAEVDEVLNKYAPETSTHAQTQALQAICDLLDREVDVFDWTGFYLASNTEERMLELGPFTGEPTDHTRIPFGTGICGQAADTLETFVVQDVSQASNYLACSVDVKSEIVVPIMKGDRFIGELDIDSHTKDAITPELQELCEEICRRLGERLF